MSSPERSRMPLPLARPDHTFSRQAVDVLREMVLNGDVEPGQRLNEVELAAALGISRGPLREAIQRLRSEGLLTAVSGRGAYVRTITHAALADLYEVRIALETHALRLAAGAPASALRDLRSVLDESGAAVDGGGAYPIDVDVHVQLVALAGNAALLDAVTEVLAQVRLARRWSGQVRTRAHEALAEHREVVDRLAARDVDGAIEVLTSHLRRSLDSARNVMERPQRLASS